jgi:hypothetical protein
VPSNNPMIRFHGLDGLLGTACRTCRVAKTVASNFAWIRNSRARSSQVVEFNCQSFLFTSSHLYSSYSSKCTAQNHTRVNPTSRKYFGNEKFVGLRDFLGEQTIKAIFKVNSVAVQDGALSHGLVAAAMPQVALG